MPTTHSAPPKKYDKILLKARKKLYHVDFPFAFEIEFSLIFMVIVADPPKNEWKSW